MANLWPEFEILTVLGAVFSHFCPDKREICTGERTCITATCRPSGAKNLFLDYRPSIYTE